jgi:HSP20 family protein
MKKNGLVPTRRNGHWSNGLFEFPSVDTWFDEFFPDKPSTQSTSINVIENDNNYLFEVAASGFDKSNFDVNIEGDTLFISGDYSNELREDEGNYKRREFSYSSFKRSFTLPKDSVHEDISAKYENGILNVIVPKSNNKDSPTKRIEIK